MACMNNLCPFNSGLKCSNDLIHCVVRNLYNARQLTYARHTYTVKQK